MNELAISNQQVSYCFHVKYPLTYIFSLRGCNILLIIKVIFKQKVQHMIQRMLHDQNHFDNRFKYLQGVISTVNLVGLGIT